MIKNIKSKSNQNQRENEACGPVPNVLGSRVSRKLAFSGNLGDNSSIVRAQETDTLCIFNCLSENEVICEKLD